METDKKLSKDAKPGEMTIRGDIAKPDIVKRKTIGNRKAERPKPDDKGQ